MQKAWYRSKTIIINVALLIVMLLAAAEPLVPALQGTLPPKFYAWIAFALPLVNLALRFATTGPIGLTGHAPDKPADGGTA